jgi:membrane fusion protein (multidrug efflux system)
MSAEIYGQSVAGAATVSDTRCRRMRTIPPTRVPWPAGLLAGVAAVAAGVSACGQADAIESAADVAVPVLVREVARLERPDYLALSGDVAAWRTVNVGFLVPGLVDSIGPSEGDAVAAGALLAVLDGAEYRLNLEMAVAQRERAEDEHARAEAMFAERAIPENDYHKATTAVRLARAQAQLAEKKLADARLEAPLSGLVARRSIQPGEQAAPGYPVFTIMQIDRVQVQVGVPEVEIGRVAVGQPATVVVPALGGAEFQGRVQLVGIAADPASRTYAVKLEVANPQRRLLPGMIAEVRIETDRTVSVLTLPGEAIVRDVDGVTRVFLYFPDEERVHSRRVTVGAPFGREVEIRDGLEVGDMVVVGGQHRIREGSSVVAEVEGLPDAAATGSR